MDIKKEGIGIIAIILFIIPLASGGYWVVKSVTSGPVVSKVDTFAVSNHGLMKFSVQEKEASELARLFDEEKEEMTLTEEEKEEIEEDAVADEFPDDSGDVQDDDWGAEDNNTGLSGNSPGTNDVPVTSSPTNHNPPIDKQTKEEDGGMREESETKQSEGEDQQDESDKTSDDEDDELDEDVGMEKGDSTSDDADGEKQEEETRDNMGSSDESKEKRTTNYLGSVS